MNDQHGLVSQIGSVWHKGTLVLFAATLVMFSLGVRAQVTQPAPNSGGSMGAATSSKEMSKPMAGDMGQAMTRGTKEMESMPKSGDADHDFAMMMRMHHQNAVEMAEIELRSGKDPKLHSMARNIISSQKKEIQQFDQWLARHKPSDGHSSSK